MIFSEHKRKNIILCMLPIYYTLIVAYLCARLGSLSLHLLYMSIHRTRYTWRPSMHVYNNNKIYNIIVYIYTHNPVALIRFNEYFTNSLRRRRRRRRRRRHRSRRRTRTYYIIIYTSYYYYTYPIRNVVVCAYNNSRVLYTLIICIYIYIWPTSLITGEASFHRSI